MVSKDVLSWSQPVAIDPSEVLALPTAARDIVKAKVGSNPRVFILNPSLGESYGAFDHEVLKEKNFKKIFGEAKGAMRKAIAGGTFIPPGKVVKVAGSQVEKWQSSAGTAIEAKLVAVEDDRIFVFETSAGKTIRTTADKLSEDSVKKARGLIAE